MAATLDPKIFEAPVRPDLIHTVVVSQQNARRRGTHATKNRAQVSGGGRKPYKQKGTGNARQGTIRAPQFEGGGIAFGPQPRSYGQRVPKQVRKAALRSALSLRKREDAIVLVESFDLPEIKTKLVVKQLDQLGASDALIVTPEHDARLERAARNLPKVRVLPVAGLNVHDVVARKHLVLVGNAPSAIAERLA
jgi:large subunit ribosomal protein L4